jgi:hypothetical protein
LVVQGQFRTVLNARITFDICKNLVVQDPVDLIGITTEIICIGVGLAWRLYNTLFYYRDPFAIAIDAVGIVYRGSLV